MALEMTYGSHHPDIHSVTDFKAISPQTSQAAGFRSELQELRAAVTMPVVAA